MDILTILTVVLLIVLFPLGQVFRIDLGSGAAINPLDIGVFIIASITIVFALVKKIIPQTVRWLGVFAGVGFLELLLNKNNLTTSEFFVSSLYLFRFICYVTLALGISYLNKNQKELIKKALLIGGGIVIGAGYIQYFFYQSLWGVLYEGWDPHLYRMFSTFLDPNFSGVFFTLYLLLILHQWFGEKRKRNKIFLGVIGAVSFLAIVLSFSRGAYVDAGIGILVYLFLRGYKKLAMGIPALIVVLSLCISFFLPYGEEKHILRTVSTEARLVSAETALTIFEKNPLLGVGFNAYRYAQHRYHLLSGFTWEDTHSGAGTNNSYLFVLATTGILGGLVYGYFWWLVMKSSWKSMQKKKPYALFFFTSWIVLLVSGIWENTLFYPNLMVWLFVLLGLTD